MALIFFSLTYFFFVYCHTIFAALIFCMHLLLDCTLCANKYWIYIPICIYICIYIYTHTYGQHLMWNMDFFPIISGHTRTIAVSERKRYLSGVVSHYLRIFSPDLKWQIENGPCIPFQGVYGLIISRERKMFTCHGKLPCTVLLYHICLDVILFL